MSDLGSTSVIPGSESDRGLAPLDDAESGRPRLRSRRGPVLNGIILVAVLVVVALIVFTVRGGDDKTETTAQTSKVDTGDVTATVSASGNVAAATAVNLNFQGSGGIVTAILVKPGDRVRKGQILAQVDQTSARQSLAAAKAQLASAEAAYAGTVQGQTSQERARDARSIDQAEVSVQNARTSLRAARRSQDLTRRQQDAAVDRAGASLTNARGALVDAQSAYDADPTAENQQALDTATQAVATAQSALIQAREGKETSLLQAGQQVQTANEQLKSALASLASTRAGVAVTRQGPRDSALQSAQAQIDTADVAVDQARTTLDQTILRAPVAGKVADVNGTVGEASTSGSASASGSSAAVSGSTSSGASSGATSTTESSGFVVLTGTNALEVTADVAEADIADVRTGQKATITFEASDREVTGSVTAIDSIETVTNNVVEYGVTVTLDEAKGIKLGQSTQIVITTGAKQDVLRVSSSALTTIGGRTTATVQGADGATRTVVVVTGLEGDGYTEVLSGLSAGDVVVLPQQAGVPGGFTFPNIGGLGGGLG